MLKAVLGYMSSMAPFSKVFVWVAAIPLVIIIFQEIFPPESLGLFDPRSIVLYFFLLAASIELVCEISILYRQRKEK
jgi:hypothetical protein